MHGDAGCVKIKAFDDDLIEISNSADRGDASVAGLLGLSCGVAFSEDKDEMSDEGESSRS
jgi:hypothetical protein